MTVTNEQLLEELEKQRDRLDELRLAVFGDKKMGIKSLNEQFEAIRISVKELTEWRSSIVNGITGAKIVVYIIAAILSLGGLANIADFLLTVFNGAP